MYILRCYKQKRSIENVIDLIKEVFMKYKIGFFKSIFMACETFLRTFQSSKPLGPFLYTYMINLVHAVIERFVKLNKIPSSLSKVLALDLHKND